MKSDSEISSEIFNSNTIMEVKKFAYKLYKFDLIELLFEVSFPDVEN